MKRKASELEESPVCHDWRVSDSATTSTASPDSIKAPHNQWTTPAIPYLNARTRKRYRDNRPDTEAVHQNTLTRLYAAQRQIHTEEIAEQRRAQQVGSYLMSLDVPEQASMHQTSVEPKQKSLDAFFGNNRSMTRPTVSHSNFSFATTSTNMVSPMVCDDCNAPLQEDPGTDGMDIDVVEHDWDCYHCSRRVCDVCSVRGDHRVCLECAVPGGRSG